MSQADVKINFDTPAILRKWPSLNHERISAILGARPYLIAEGTLDECIRQFMSKPASQHHMYEIHTTPQQTLVLGGPQGDLESGKLRYNGAK